MILIREPFNHCDLIPPLSISDFRQAIVHLDADAFFASVEQAKQPCLKGRPVVVGKNRGIVSSLSYEAKALGITRGYNLRDIAKQWPQVKILAGDYQTYAELSRRMFAIVRRYTDIVEEASIDECYADITGMRRPLKKNYIQIVEAIKFDLETELGCPFSLGLAPTKTLAKLASKHNKPSGITVVPGRYAQYFIHKKAINEVCGIGTKTTSWLHGFGIKTALDLASKNIRWAEKNLNKPLLALYWELRGVPSVAVKTKHAFNKSLSAIKTFTPASKNINKITAELTRNCEKVCAKARRQGLLAKGVVVRLKTKEFTYKSLAFDLVHATADNIALMSMVESYLHSLYDSRRYYRATQVALYGLRPGTPQPDLFGSTKLLLKREPVIKSVDVINGKYGRGTVTAASALMVAAPQLKNTTPTRNTLQQKAPIKKLVIPYLGVVMCDQRSFALENS